MREAAVCLKKDERLGFPGGSLGVPWRFPGGSPGFYKMKLICGDLVKHR